MRATPVFLLSLVVAAGNLAAQATYTDLVLSANPAAYWNFNEASGNAVDQVTGNPSYALTPHHPSNNRAPGPVLSNGYSLGNVANLPTGQNPFFYGSYPAVGANWAFEMWFKLDSLSNGPGEFSNYYLINFANNAPYIVADYSTQPNGNDRISIGGQGWGNFVGDLLTVGEWTHFVYFQHNGIGRQFLNGIEFSSTINVTDIPVSTITVGSQGGTGYVRGQMDEVAIYDLTGFDATQANALALQIAGHYSAVPEPAVYAAGLGMAALGLAFWNRRRQAKRLAAKA